MNSLLAFAALVVVLVAAAVLPRRAAEDPSRFPWFWVAFPLTALALALTAYLFLPAGPLNTEFGWTMYAPLADATEDSGDTAAFNWQGVFWAAASLAGAGLSAWAWRRGRV
ncbi:hypothetical protein [uncultured Corynebacterium sp.]|uniref:hypothetical protein n=1 Tax=uncultured Corynebacterium sp. TaxID=159447 RepID=UPI0025998490|nr:hypothetical protein [uncultured Corynebacterium sp.]